MKKFIPVVIVVALTSIGSYSVLGENDKGDKIVATVNEQEIKYRQIAPPGWFLEAYLEGLGEEEGKEKKMQLQKRTLKRQIRGILLRREIERREITVSEEELMAVAREKAEYTYYVASYDEKARELHKEMTGEELTLERLKEQFMRAPDVKWGIKRNKLFKSVFKGITVTEEEVKNYYYSLPLRENKKVKAEYFWHQDRSVIEAVQRELKAGVDGEQLVRKYKLYPDDRGGNRINIVLRHMFSTEEDLKVLKMDEGEVSEITKVKEREKDYFQVIRLTEIIEVEERKPLAEIREEIREKLYENKERDTEKDFWRKLLKEADIKFYVPEYSLSLDEMSAPFSLP
jgi:hypothetical protein